MYDLLPAVEERYRGIGEGWARATMGGSTGAITVVSRYTSVLSTLVGVAGGWESIASQVFYPDEFNGAFAACPDPVAFTSYATVNIYEVLDFNHIFSRSTYQQAILGHKRILL